MGISASAHADDATTAQVRECVNKFITILGMYDCDTIERSQDDILKQFTTAFLTETECKNLHDKTISNLDKNTNFEIECADGSILENGINWDYFYAAIETTNLSNLNNPDSGLYGFIVYETQAIPIPMPAIGQYEPEYKTYGSYEYINGTRRWGSNWDGCFKVCGKSKFVNYGQDLMTQFVLEPALKTGKKYCIDSDKMNLLTEENPDGTTKIVMLTREKAAEVMQKIPAIADKGACDGHWMNGDINMVQYLLNKFKSDGNYSLADFMIRTASESQRIDE